MGSPITRPSIVHSLVAAAALCMPAAAGVRSAFAYTLSSDAGAMPLSWSSLNWDAAAGELYVVDSSEGVVDVFNESGMAVYAFGNDSDLGSVEGAVPLESGQLALLAVRGSSWTLWRCNFRGDPIAAIALRGVPGSFKEFRPDTLRGAGGKLYLADKSAMKVLAVGIDGAVAASYDVRALLKLGKKNAAEDLRGFNVDARGNLFGTVPGLFLAFVVAPDGQVRTFGARGSSPGKFNIVAGIAADEAGHVFVTDTLKCAVLVFDQDLKFIDQFGYRGLDDDGLIAPQDIAVGGGRVFVSQSRGGVKAFDVLLE